MRKRVSLDALNLEIGRSIRASRIARGLSQKEVAESCGVPVNTVSRWETATYKLRVTDLYALASSFRCGLDELLPSIDPAAILVGEKATGRKFR